MKKILILMAAFVILFTGCKKETNKVIDFQKLSESLLSSQAFTEQLTELDSDTGCGQYRIAINDCKKAVFYFSSGATAEELAMFEAADSNALSRIKEAINKRVKAQTDSFEDYVPSEVPKLNKAVIYESGNYIILIVADNYDAVKAVLDGI